MFSPIVLVRVIFSPVTFLVFFSGLAASGEAFAAGECQCPAAPPPLKESYQQSAAVFVGTIETYSPSALRTGMNEARVRLMSRFKGFEDFKSPTLYVYTPDGPEKCGIKLLTGQDYLFYADGSMARLVVTACSRTGILDNALDEMEELQKLAKH